MEQSVQQSVNYAQKWTYIEYIKSWVDEMYSHRHFCSCSLQTLQLCKEFKEAYRLFQQNNTEPDFLGLYVISQKLEGKLLEEENLR